MRLSESGRSLRSSASPALRRAGELIPTTAVFALGGAGMFMFQALALRLMPPEGVGTLVLAYGIASVGATIAGGGMAALLARTVSVEPSQLEWRHAAWLTSTAVAAPLACGMAFIALAFPSIRALGLVGWLVLVFLMVSQNLQLVESSYRRASGRFITGAAIQQFTLVVLSGVLLVPLVLSRQVSPTTVLWIMLGVQVGLVVASAVGFTTKQSGAARDFVRWLRGQRRLLFGFWAAASLSIGFRWADRLVIAAVLSVHDLARYQSIFLLTTLFDLLSIGIGYVNLPRYARLGRWSKRNLSFLALLVVGTTLLTAALALPLGHWLFLIHWTSQDIATLVVLMAVGVAKLLYAEFSAAVGALAEGGIVIRFAGLVGLSLLFGVSLSIGLGLAWGMVGAAVGSLVAWTMRVGVSYRYTIR